MDRISNLTIRRMHNDERRAVRAILRHSFPLLEQCVFEWTPYVLIAEQDGQILGAIVLKLFTLPLNRQGGSISWLFIAPEARGRGLGQALVEAGLNFFEQQGCDEILVTVEGFNTSSSKLFALRGFGILSPAAQFQRYGLATFWLWAKLFHYFETGYFLWARPAPQAADRALWQWWGTIIANSIIGFIMLWRLSLAQSIAPVMGLMLLPVLIGLFGLRSLGMGLMALRQGLKVRFRAWESGFPLSIAIALALGGLYPLPGGLYPTTGQWRYRDWLPQLGWMALAGTLPVLILVWGVWLIAQMQTVSPDWRAVLAVTLLLGKPLVFFDIVLPFFPFRCFNGRCLWDWNKPVWVLLAMAAIALCLV